MYIVKIKNGQIETPIHDEKQKLRSGKVVKGINTIDSFTFSMLPANAGFDLINEFQTLVTVYNTNKKRYDFIGRVLHPESSMSQEGLIEKAITCESVFGYLCDSQQPYVATQNWTVSGLFHYLIENHNSQTEDYKRFEVGNVTVTDPNDNLYLGIQRENTWEAIKKNLIEKLGGELQYRVVGDVIYIDYLEKVGETKTTPIELSVNMKAITREKDPTTYVTRLIPLGAKLGEDTEERLDITSVNNGLDYIDDEAAIAVYGIHVGYVTFDDVTVASNLLSKGRSWMNENNRVQIKYSITNLDLSLLGLSVDSMDVGNYHPIKNPLLGIDDTARIIKKSIDICEEVKSTIEMGDNFKTLADIQQEQAKQLEEAAKNWKEIHTTIVDLENKTSSTQQKLAALQNKVDGVEGLYFYIKYSAYSDGYIMTDVPDENTLYMGTCSTNEEIAPTDHTKYIWTRVRGLDGENAITCYIDSSTGYTFKLGETATLKARLFDGMNEIDPNGELDYTWYRRIDGSAYQAFANGKTIYVSESVFNQNMDIYFVCGVEEQIDDRAVVGVAVAGVAIVGKGG